MEPHCRQAFVPQLGPETDPNEDNKYKSFSLRFVFDDAGRPITDLVAAFDPGCTEVTPRGPPGMGSQHCPSTRTL
jgi:hypothetical protein